MSNAWDTTRSVLVVVLAAVFTLFALAEGMAVAADPQQPDRVRVLAALAALAPVAGAAATHRVLRRRRPPATAVIAAAWVALALANATLVVLLVI